MMLRYAVFTRNTDNLLGIHSVGYGEDPSITRFGPGCRDQYIIHYVLGGKGVYNGSSICAGQGFLIRPYQKECYFPKTADPWKFLWVIATGEAMGDIFARYAADRNGVFEFDSLDILKKCAKSLIENANKTYDSLELTEMFLHILNSHTHSASHTDVRSNADMYADLCVDYIEKNIHRRITVSELTEFLGVSQPYLYTVFRNRFGSSVKRYITAAKHTGAKKLLTGTSLSVTEIANSVGYEDVLAFSKAFKKEEKMSPTDYRRSHLHPAKE